MKRLVFLVLGMLLPLWVQAQEDAPVAGVDSIYSVLSGDTLADEIGLIPESLDANVDSLLHSWHVSYFSKRDSFCHDDEENVFFPDSVYVERLSRLPRVIRLTYNNVVRDCIDLYAERRRGLIRYMVGMADFYFPIIEEVLDKHGLPLELKYLAVVESYNCGPGNVNKAIRRSGGKHDFWDIYPYLPRETRSYVPLFIAANYIMNYYCDHNICPIQTDLPLATDTVKVGKMVHLKQVAEVLGVDLDLIKVLNPQYKRDIVPGNTGREVLKLPAAQTYLFAEHEDSIASYKAEEYLAQYLPQNQQLRNSGTATRERITHIVLKGENLYTIANRYGVTARDIKKWNGLSSTRVARGKRLVLYVDNGGVSLAASRKKTDTAGVTAKNTSGTGDKADSSGKFVFYEVKSGDSLYTISKKYPGVTISAIQKANGLRGSSIHPGQKLKIPNG